MMIANIADRLVRVGKFAEALDFIARCGICADGPLASPE
jgi:hypothetical protein